MIESIIYFLPCLVALLWSVSFSFKVKTQGETIYMWFLMASVLYLVAYGIYLYPDTDYHAMVRLESICLPAGLIMTACLVVYLQMLRTKGKMNKNLLFLLLLPAIVEGTALALLYAILGFKDAAIVGAAADKAGQLPEDMYSPLNAAYCLFSETVFNALATIYVILICLSCIQILDKEHYRPQHTWKFLFGGMKASYSRLVAVEVTMLYANFFVMLYPGRLFVVKHPELGISLAIITAIMYHCLSHTVFYHKGGESVTLYELSHLGDKSAKTMDGLVLECTTATVAAEPSPMPFEAEQTEHDTPPLAHTDLHAETHHSESNMALLERFRKLMEEDEIWKDENLNMTMLYDILGVGRTTLSTLLNMEYGIPFRDIVNQYRIEEAKRYMKENPRSTQETIADHCGFKNAQYFNTKFKDVVGQTPQAWLADSAKQAEEIAS